MFEIHLTNTETTQYTMNADYKAGFRSALKYAIAPEYNFCKIYSDTGTLLDSFEREWQLVP